ncbi:MAG: hypothetical protein AAF468_22595 [Pseudomonadota bacterium]
MTAKLISKRISKSFGLAAWLFIGLGCASQEKASLLEGIWHNSELLGEFTEVWSSCYSFAASTQDLRWMLHINVGTDAGEFDARKVVKLYDFSTVSDRESAMSLFQGSDIKMEKADPIAMPALDGDGTIHRTERLPAGSTFDLDLHDLVFVFPGEVIKIDRVTFYDMTLSNFCAG